MRNLGVLGSIRGTASLLAARVSTGSCLSTASLSSSRRCFSATRVDPAKMYYTKKHEYIRVEDCGTLGTVGITNYAQEALGDVVFAQLPEVGDSVVQFEECGAVESVKAASEVYSPATGMVTAKNEKVEELPALLNSSAEDEGWMFKMSLSKPDQELGALLDLEGYKAYLKSQEDDH